MKNKITLISPPSNCVLEDRVEPNLGLLYLASTLRENGNDNVSVCDMAGCHDAKSWGHLSP